MRLTRLASALAGLVLSATAGSAHALVITAGDIKFTLDAYSAGTIGYGNAVGVQCSTVASCDAAAGSPAAGAIGSEDSWGIFSVALISNISSGTTLFTKGVDGFLTGMFFGLQDALVAVSSPLPGVFSTTALAQGGSVRLYRSATDYDPNPGGTNNAPSMRVGPDVFPGVPNAPLWLSADFGAGVLAGDTVHTYQTTYNNATLAGQGQGFLDITGGEAAAIFDTNALVDPNGNRHDMFLDITFNDANGGASRLGWLVTSSGQVKAIALPEPGSLGLLGIGGIVGGLMTRRRRRA